MKSVAVMGADSKGDESSDKFKGHSGERGIFPRESIRRGRSLSSRDCARIRAEEKSASFLSRFIPLGYSRAVNTECDYDQQQPGVSC